MYYYDIEKCGKRIKELRRSRGITQEQLADSIGISQKTIAGIETGNKGTTIDTMLAIVSVLETSLDYLLLGYVGELTCEKGFQELSEAEKKLALRIWKGVVESVREL